MRHFFRPRSAARPAPLSPREGKYVAMSNSDLAHEVDKRLLNGYTRASVKLALVREVKYRLLNPGATL